MLALLPIGGGSNQQKAFDRTDDLLADLRQAALRAETTDEFKEAIRELRRRKRERGSSSGTSGRRRRRSCAAPAPGADSAQMVSRRR